MQLGIVVVYLVRPDNGPLLDLHLRQIERCTTVPFTLFAGVNRLLPEFQHRLDQHSFAKVCPVPPTELRGSEEHAYYLDQLIEAAFQDGATHVVTLHVDSFPVRRGWAKELTDNLTPECPVAAIQRTETGDEELPLSACLLFTRDYWLRCRPRFLLPKELIASPEFQAFRDKYFVNMDSGTGFGYSLFTHGLHWYRLLRTNRHNDHYLFAGIYGDLIFHLGSATWLNQMASTPPATTPRRLAGRLLLQLKKSVLLQRMRNVVKRMLPRGAHSSLQRGQNILSDFHQEETLRVYDTIRKKLFEDPQRYLMLLRTGHVPTAS